MRFSTRRASAYWRGGDRTRRLFNAAVLDEVHVREGHVVEAAYKETYLLFTMPKLEYHAVVVVETMGLEPTTSCLQSWFSTYPQPAYRPQLSL